MYFSKLLIELKDFYKESTVYIHSHELARQYDENRLETIRENWKIMFLVLKSVVIVSSFLLSFGTDGIVMMRTLSFLLLFIKFTLLGYIIAKNDFIAKYWGSFLIFVITMVMTEMNMKFVEYKYAIFRLNLFRKWID
jgi:hypothetical protein